jgi:hypothetical protein
MLLGSSRTTNRRASSADDAAHGRRDILRAHVVHGARGISRQDLALDGAAALAGLGQPLPLLVGDERPGNHLDRTCRGAPGLDLSRCLGDLQVDAAPDHVQPDARLARASASVSARPAAASCRAA